MNARPAGSGNRLLFLTPGRSQRICLSQSQRILTERRFFLDSCLRNISFVIRTASLHRSISSGFI